MISFTGVKSALPAGEQRSFQTSGFQSFSCSDPFCNPILPNNPLRKISSQAYVMLLCLQNRK